jgi:hypothetical protein
MHGHGLVENGTHHESDQPITAALVLMKIEAGCDSLGLLYEKGGFLETRYNTVKNADTVVQQLMER